MPSKVMFAADARKVISAASRDWLSAMALARLPPMVPSSASPANAGEEKTQGWLLGYSSLTAHEIETAVVRLAGVLRGQ